MKIAVIGAGGIAQRGYFPLIMSWPNLDIVSVYSRTQATLDKNEKRWGLKNGTTSLQNVIESKPHAALVLTNNESHYDICKYLLENDIDILVEKPMTLFSNQAHHLARIAKEKQRIICVAFNRRYALLYKQAREIFGNHPVRSAIIQKHRAGGSHKSLFGQYSDDSIHQIDLMRFFCGEVKPLHTAYDIKNNVLVSAVSTARISSGGLATMQVSLNAGAWQESVTLHGDGLSVHVDAFRELRVRKGKHEEVYGLDRAGSWVNDLRERGFQGEIEHFLECVKTRQTPLTSASEAIKTQELMEKMVMLSGDQMNLPVLNK